MQTRREYAASLGLAKMGRGKFSTAAKEAIAKAEAEGIKFSDVAAPTRTAPPATKDTAPVVKSPTDTPYLSPSDFRFPEVDYRAVDGNGKERSLREVCNTCRVSLVNHMCDSPTILGNIAVVIRERR